MDAKEQESKQYNESCDFSPYMMELTAPIIKLAKTVLGETPERRKDCLQKIRERLKDEDGLSFRDEDGFLLLMLRARRFDVQRAVSMIKRYYQYHETYQKIFQRQDPTSVERFIKDRIVSLLPYRDRNNRAIIVVKSEYWDASTFSPNDLLYGFVVAMSSALVLPVNQITGYVAICDFKHLSAKQIFKLIPRYVCFCLQGLQYCYPCRVSAFHLVNFPEACLYGWAIIKSLLSEKIRQRVTFYRRLEDLHSIFPKSILPLELGGDLGPIDNSHWAKDTSLLLEEHIQNVSFGYNQHRKTDKSLSQRS